MSYFYIQIFLISERNSVAANMQLLRDLDCSVLMTTDTQFAPVRDLLSERESLTVIELKSLDELLNEPQPEYSFNKKLRGMESQTAFAVHTSGSTG
jgi:hypothetical protein